jgi:hypothetical protein
MARPKSGNPPWDAVAVKLPPWLIAEAERYSDLYHVSVSALLREGLILRIQGQQAAEPFSGITVIPPATMTVFTRLADTLSTAATELRKMCHPPIEEGYNGYTSPVPATQEPTTERHSSGNTVIPRLSDAHQAAIAILDADAHSDDSNFDPAKHLLGKLCPRKHNYRGTGQSVLRLSNRHCRACDREKFHERKQAQRQAVRA